MNDGRLEQIRTRTTQYQTIDILKTKTKVKQKKTYKLERKTRTGANNQNKQETRANRQEPTQPEANSQRSFSQFI